MSRDGKDTVALALGWDALGETAGYRRNSVGFGQLKEDARAAAESGTALRVNAFLYAFLCPAKNFDLFLQENFDAVAGQVDRIQEAMLALQHFERTGDDGLDSHLRSTYLALRRVVARRSARDERRTLATLLFSGPSTPEQISQDLGITVNLVERTLLALALVVDVSEDGTHVLNSEPESLAVVLQLLQSTLGFDPIRVLKRRIEARESERADAS